MYMIVWRPLVVLVGLGGLGGAGLIAAFVSPNPPASEAVTVFGLLMMVVQGVVGVGLIVAGLWGPLRRLAATLTGHPER
jgi:hypothetical protein